MLAELDKVKIKKTGTTGVIVDIYKAKDSTFYTVESDERGVPGGFGEKDSYKLFECIENELERL